MVPGASDPYEGIKTVAQSDIWLEIVDSCGDEDLVNETWHGLQTADLYIICNTVNNRKAFDNLKSNWTSKLQQINYKAPKVLFMTKKDLRDEEWTTEGGLRPDFIT